MKRPRAGYAFGLLLGILLSSNATALDELEQMTDEAIFSACHGFVLEGLSNRIASLLGTESPLCRRVKAGEAPRAAVQAERRIVVPDSGQTYDRSNAPRRIDMECEMDFLCIRERTRAESMGHPMEMPTYERIREACNGQYGCIENRLANWPRLPPQASATELPTLLPFQREYLTRSGSPLYARPDAEADVITMLSPGARLQSTERTADGRWIRLVNVYGQTGFVPAQVLQRADTIDDSASAHRSTIASDTPTASRHEALDLAALVRSGRVSQQHQHNEMQRIEQQRLLEQQQREREEQARIERERAEQAERERRIAAERERQRRAEAQAQARQSDGNFFGALAAGLAATAIGANAGMDANAAVNFGTSIARDINEGTTRNTQQFTASQSAAASASSSGSTAAASTGGASGNAAKGPLRSESYAAQCPLGKEVSLPLTYRTQACRSAMIDFALAYMCNDFERFQQVQSRCVSACGTSTCNED
jgi:hypothetical protein